jgi:hypothetical protein
MENIRRILREEMELNPTERVYDYDPGRDTVPERLPFDIDKLVNSGVVFVTPAINGNPKSKNYKKWMKTPHTHLISLYNVENSSEDGWILKAITKRASTGQLKGNFVDKIYDGKYNQILWSLEKLGINPMDMLNDANLQESIIKVLREETEVIPSFILRRIGGYVNNILLVYGNYNLKGNFKNLIDEISDVIINDLVSDYIDSIGYTVDDEDDNYDQSVVDKIYDKYYNLLKDHIQGNYSDEIYKLYRKNKK